MASWGIKNIMQRGVLNKVNNYAEDGDTKTTYRQIYPIWHGSEGTVQFRCHAEFKVQQYFLRFLVGSHGNTEMKVFPASLCPPLPLFLTLCAGLDWPFGNCFSCLGCLTVAPICSDYMHIEWTRRRTGWLFVTNVLWHPPPLAAILFLGLSVSSLFYVPSRWQMCSTSLAGLTCNWPFIRDQWEAFSTAEQLYERNIPAPTRAQHTRDTEEYI